MKKTSVITFLLFLSLFVISVSSLGFVSSVTCDLNAHPTYTGCVGYYQGTTVTGGSCSSSDPNYPNSNCIGYTNSTSCSDNPKCFWTNSYNSVSCSGLSEATCTTTTGCTAQYSCSCDSGYSLTATGTSNFCSGGTYSLSTASCGYSTVPTQKTSPVCYGLSQADCLSQEKCSWTNASASVSCTYANPSPSCPSGCTTTTVSTYSCVANPTSYCTDTDGGQNYTVQGTVTASSGVNGTDVCADGTHLNEYYCSNNVGTLQSSVLCANGCSSGKCNSAIPDCQTGCTVDSDCSSGICRLDISGVNRCVPSSSVCALGTTSSCGVVDGYQTCSSGASKTCNQNGGWASQTCTYGCNATTGVCNPSTAPWWHDYYDPDLTRVLVGPISISQSSPIYMVAKYLTSGTFSVSSGGSYVGSSTVINGINYLYNSSWLVSYNPGTTSSYTFSIGGLTSNSLSVTSNSAPYCGDNIITSPEVCDGTALGGATCSSLGYYSGCSISCNSTCTGYTVTGAHCGDGTVQTANGEQCDGTNLNGATCQTQGFSSGTLSCNSTCGFNTANCVMSTCGNGVIDTGEQCDGSNLNGQTCQTQGFASGALSCSSTSCQFDTTNCVPVQTYCGDGFVQSPNSAGVYEVCDSSSTSCTNLGNYTAGTATCNSQCTGWDTVNCQTTNTTLDQCLNVNFCGDYNSTNFPTGVSTSCNSDVCNVASQTPPLAGAGQTNTCQWSTTTSLCNKVNVYSSGGVNIGSCAYNEGSTTDTCADGFLSHSWNATWTWDPHNVYAVKPNNGTDYIVGGDGFYHYDPQRASYQCAPGSATVPCPAQVELNYFDWRNIVVAVLVIFLIYIFTRNKRKFIKKKIVKKSSKKRK